VKIERMTRPHSGKKKKSEREKGHLAREEVSSLHLWEEKIEGEKKEKLKVFPTTLTVRGSKGPVLSGRGKKVWGKERGQRWSLTEKKRKPCRGTF